MSQIRDTSEWFGTQPETEMNVPFSVHSVNIQFCSENHFDLKIDSGLNGQELKSNLVMGVTSPQV